MRLLIRPKTVPSSPLQFQKTESSLILWILRIPWVMTQDFLKILWDSVKTWMWILLHLAAESVLFWLFALLILLVFQPSGGLVEAHEIASRPTAWLVSLFAAVISYATYLLYPMFLINSVLFFLRALTFVRRKNSYRTPQREVRIRR